MRKREQIPLTDDQRRGIEELVAMLGQREIDELERAIVDASPDIDVESLSSEHWWVLVLWLHGMKVLEIARQLRMVEGAVQHPIRERKNGGKLPKARKDMTKEERLHHLRRLKEHRMDDGKLPDRFFTVKAP